jgi:thymidylate synthase (FAD)
MSPRVRLLSSPTLNTAFRLYLEDLLPPGEAFWREEDGATPAESIIEFAGRVCYLSFGSKQSDRSNAEYISNLIRNGHESVLEHAVWTFAFSGISRAFTHQLVRHRVGFSFSQLSQQYHDESEARFVRPHGIDSIPEAAEALDRALNEARRSYKEILTAVERANQLKASPPEKTRAIRSAARSVLPNATETAIVVTANARSLRYFLRTRGGIVGDFEMRLVATELLELLRPEAPSVFADFSIEWLADGQPIVRHHVKQV